MGCIGRKWGELGKQLWATWPKRFGIDCYIFWGVIIREGAGW
jgi:hypothetical protein